MNQMQQFIQQYNTLCLEYHSSQDLLMIELYASLLTLPIILVLFYLFRNKIKSLYNRLWFYLFKNSILVSKRDRDTTFKGILIGIFIVMSVFSFGVIVIHAETKQGFSEMLLLNENGAVGGYTSNVIPGQLIEYNVLVENHEGKPMFYKLSVILQNSSTGDNETITSSYKVLSNNQQWKVPINFTVSNTGNYKIIFILYYYNSSESKFEKTNLFTQTFLTVK
ncbi:DUF1616 domain-containing protein [Sulfuracidifex tepidarius]|uniref:DUF1616 domain-containing protein n=1 Tax=Sulfuracidifex tepidarius TaxID=1294262 RepID=A0A510E550_9CREN|nr:DUF1616 domain-containing protein [Sulfuracidifex tepidarius]BBG24880.1 hypothetical protein IC006_2214 [Sulfuracidifex tepidarius]BBG27665.1 hypothetical protein IC007_2219 [Sulfuracidifex tepidarius]